MFFSFQSWFLFLILFNVGATRKCLTLQFNEEQPIGSVVGYLRDLLYAKGIEVKTDDVFRWLRQRCYYSNNYDRCNKEADWLQMIDESSGKITQAQRIDREQLCGKSPVCFIEIRFLILPQRPYQEDYCLELYIGDINDNRPVFNPPIARQVIEETSLVGHVVDLSNWKAMDADLGLNGEISYKLLTNTSTFSLVTDDGSFGLKLMQKLDYAVQSMYKLDVEASDHSNKSLKALLRIRISVTNFNNFPPTFEQQVYNLTIRESFQPGHLLLQVTATDKDYKSGLGTMTYSIAGRYTDENEDLSSTASLSTGSVNRDCSTPINIRPDDGWLVLCRPVNYPDDDGMKIMISAVDDDKFNPREGTSIVQIHVEDENNHDPELHLTCFFNCANETIYIDESYKPGSAILHISKSDGDSNLNGHIDLAAGTFASPHDFSTFYASDDFEIDETDILRIKKELDHEKDQQMKIVIKACDRGLPHRRCIYRAIKVVILDKNDHKPYFVTTCPYIIHIKEDTPINTLITKIQALDLDDVGIVTYAQNPDEANDLIKSTYGKIKYMITSFKTLPVAIDSKSGDVTLIAELDFEQRTTYQIEVKAVDGGGEEAVCDVELRVDDVNDNAPRFFDPPKNFSRIHLSQKSDFIFKATDNDLNSSVTFSYDVTRRDGQIVSGCFLLDPSSGRITVDDVSGGNLKGEYEVFIEARDNGLPPRTTRLVVIFEVDDDVINETGHVKSSEMSFTLFLALIVSGILIFLITFLLIFIFCLRRRRKASSTPNSPTPPVYKAPVASSTISKRDSVSRSDLSSNEIKSLISHQALPENHRQMEARGIMASQSRCTRLCEIYGHSDRCWMPTEHSAVTTAMTPMTSFGDHYFTDDIYSSRPSHNRSLLMMTPHDLPPTIMTSSTRKDSGCESVDTKSSSKSSNKPPLLPSNHQVPLPDLVGDDDINLQQQHQIKAAMNDWIASRSMITSSRNLCSPVGLEASNMTTAC